MPSTQRGSQSGSSSSRQSTALVPGMKGLYEQNLKMQEHNYNNVLLAYGQGQQQLAGSLNSIYAGYGGVENKVMHTLGVDGGGWGVAAPAAAQIQQNAAQSFGQQQQRLMNSGLGNTTVLAGLQGQNTLFANQAMAGLGAQLAQTAAGYQSQIGMAGLGAQMQGAGMQSNFAQAYMGDLSRFEFRNNVGSLTGGFGNSQSSNVGSNEGQSLDNPGRGGGGLGGGGMETNPNGVGGPGGNFDFAAAYGNPSGTLYGRGDSWQAGGTAPGGAPMILPQTDQGNYAGSYGEAPYNGPANNASNMA